MTLIVSVDASVSGNSVGIGIAGDLGEYGCSLEHHSSSGAEIAALRMAVALARWAGMEGENITFRSDCIGAVADYRHRDLPTGWRVEHIPRARNKRAHQIAGHHCLKMQVANGCPKPVRRSREWLEAHSVPRWNPLDHGS